ncbi:unnamed protein product [Fusarium venenatum]|uniref:Mannosyl-oligosaccharide glucosidase n=1 Tax=Fusarium venenatum TaxID=56646 RepID=A0A2L2TID1_9HYPO|nr:uncharacterized protein FVRRES_04295 [Fusarium venenatum]CEI67783.1 unnamed protein product [Fusarium venenatum]
MVIIDGHEFLTEEEKRTKEDCERAKYWKKWGPYVAERQWATSMLMIVLKVVDFTYMKTSKGGLHGEDGIAGVCDSHGYFNIAFSFWDGEDNTLKERLFGTSSKEGNHGESIKKAHFHLDNVPTHSYMKYLYKYPQNAFPYQKIQEDCRKPKEEHEYSLFDTGVFENDAYWDIFIEFAKSADDPDDLYLRATAWNRGNDRAPLHIIPQAWFRNTWGWRQEALPIGEKPVIEKIGDRINRVRHTSLGEQYLVLSPSSGTGDDGEDVLPQMLFTENETNLESLGLGANKGLYVKDAFHSYIVNNDVGAVNQHQTGTKFAAWYAFNEDGGVRPRECAVVRFKLMRQNEEYLDEELFDDVIGQRRMESDEFYYRISPLPMSDDLLVKRRSTSPVDRKNIRNKQGKHIHWDHVLLVRDSWEYPFVNPWDSAFNCVVLAMIDPDFVEYQLNLLTRKNYMQPSGQIPSNDCNFDEVDPPVLAWGVFRVFKIKRKIYGRQDLDFLESLFQKLMLHFTWWVNRKDTEGKNIFEGGYLGLDNIGPFNRSAPLPTGGVGVLEQADSTAWMAFYCLTMLNISLELAKYRRIYEGLP